MTDPLRLVCAVVEVSTVFPLMVGKESLRATMPPGRDKRIVVVGFLIVIAWGTLLILFTPSGLA